MSSEIPILRIKAIPFNQICPAKNKEETFYLGVLKLKDLVPNPMDTASSNYRIDSIDANPDGYQRPRDPRRLGGREGLIAYLTQDLGVFPNALTFNIRGKYHFTEDGILEIYDKPWLIDGQHRLYGLEEVAKQDPRFLEYQIPVVFSVLADRLEEMRLFYVINDRAKSVPVDIVTRHLIIEERERGLTEEVIKRLDEIVALRVADELATNPDSVWYGRIQLSKQPIRAKTNVITEKSFFRSLLPVVRIRAYLDAYSGSEENKTRVVKTIASHLMNYWSAIRDLCPESWNDVRNYVLCLTTGVYIMHLVYPSVFELCRDVRDFSKERFLELLKQTKIGDSFWHRQAPAASGTGYSHYRRIAMDITSRLPKAVII